MSTSSSGARKPPRGWVLIAVVVAMAVALVATVVLVRRPGDTSGPAAPVVSTTTATSTVTPSPTRPSPTTSPTTSTPTTRAPSAVDSLAGFFSAAAKLGQQLRNAATAINAAGPPWTGVSPRLAGLVAAADLRPVARAIPTWLPDDLRTAVILVYSDLSSRRHAMGSFQSTAAMEGRTSSDLLRELGNGHPAAARFARDVAATRSLASETAPIAPVPKSSRRTAELLLLIRYVETANAGCDSRGGTVITEPLKIVWQHEQSEPYRDGTIGGIWFTADLGADDEWQINLFAC